MSFIERLKQRTQQRFADAERRVLERRQQQAPAPTPIVPQRPAGIQQLLKAVQPIIQATRPITEPIRELQQTKVNIEPIAQPKQIPEETRKKAKQVKEFGQAVLRDPFISMAQLQLKALGLEEMTPETRAQRFLFGEAPIKVPERAGADILRGFGAGEEGAERFGGAVGYPLAALGVIPFIGTKKRLARQIAKQGKEDTVKRTITQGIKGITDDEATTLARELTPIKDEKIVQRRLDDFVRAKQQGGVVTPTPPELEPLAREARKFESAEEFVNKSGIVPEWGTRNQYYLNNPYKSLLDKMKISGKYDSGIVKEAERWELEQVLKDKPAFLSSILSKEELKLFSKKNNLQFGSKDNLAVVAKDIDSLNRVLNAIDTGNPRELGLALGYQDIGVIMGGGKPIAAKSQLTDLWHQARQETPPARAITPPTPVEVIRDKARVGARTPRERSLITRVKETAPELKQKVQGQYIPRSTDNLAIKARNLIRDDIVTAERIAREGIDDTSVAVASELMNHYNNLAATAKTEVDRLKFYDRTADIANELAPILTAQGRTIQAAAIYGRMTPEGILRFSARQIQKYNEEIKNVPPLVRKMQGLPDKIPPITGQQTKELVEEARKIINMPDGEDKAMAFHRLQDKIAELTPTPLFRKIISLWKAGLLTGIKTTGLNLSANLFHGVSEVIKDAPAVIVDSVASLFTGKREVPFTVRKTIEGVKEGFRKGWRHLTTGLDERRIGAKLDYKRIHYGNSPVAQALQKYERSIFNIIGAGDQPFYYGAKARAIQSQAIAQAMNKRLRGIEAKNFVDNLVANPTDEMLKNAVGDAETAVFANPTELGRIARQVQEIGGGAGEIVVPFARTPAAVAMQILNYSPIGILRGIGMGIAAGRDFAKIQRQFSMAMGRGITGTAVLGLGSWLYGRDRISLGFPRDERERKQWELEGKQPNSIKVGDKWRQAHLLGPLGLMLIWGGHVRNFYDETGSATATANVTEALARSVSGMAKTFTEQTFVRGVESALGLITDPERNWERSMRTLLGPFGPSAIPTIVSDVARATDPYQRRTGEGLRGIWLDGAMARIPGLRQQLEPKIDVTGQKVERPGSPLEIMIDPTRPLEAKTSPVIAELGRLSAADYKVTPTDFGGRHGFKSLTPEQNTLLEQSAGQRLFTALNDLIISEEYQIMSDEEKAKTIQDFTERARINARAELLKEILYGPGGPQGPALTAKIQELKDDKVLTQGVRERLLDILQE